MKYKIGDKVKVQATPEEFEDLSIGYEATIERLTKEESVISEVMPNAKIGNGERLEAYILDSGFIIPEKYLVPSTQTN